MKFIYIIFLNLIIDIVCPIPNWDFSKNSFELSDTQLEYQVCSKTTYSVTATITKKITKNENSVSFQNYIEINGNKKGVDFEDIDSVYENQLGATKLVCPKSKYHPYNFDTENYIKPTNNNFENGEDFQLKCYNHDTGYFIVAYLANGESNFYLTKDNGANWNSNSIKLFKGIYDFDLTNGNNGNNGEYAMVYLTLKDDNKLYVIGTKLTLKTDYVGRADCSTKELISAKSHSKGYFKNGAFYYITYDTTSFNSGYSTTGVSSSDSDSANNAVVVNNYDNPFDFNDEIEIEEINFIENTNYVYYILTNKNTDKKNYGLINMITNQIIYNTDEEITSFVPYNSNQMLAITSTSAFRICTFINDDGTDCVESCSGNYVLDTGNKCKSECSANKILLIPQRICNLTCDENYFQESNAQCGLCKDITDSTPYKLIGTSGCKANLDENSEEYYNVDKKLLMCKSGYKLENNICTLISNDEQIIETIKDNCKNKRCQTCNSESDELELCLSCDEDKYKKVNYTKNFFKYFDCIEEKKLETKYYFDAIDNQYKPCYDLCLKCSDPGNATVHNCLECEDNYMFRPGDNPYNNCVVKSEFYYLSPYKEYKPLSIPQCPEIAKFKIKNNKNQIYCIYDCKEDKTFKYLYNGNCLKKCPEGTTNDNKNICIENAPNKIYISKEPFYSDNSNETIKSIEILAMTYADEFKYTDNHISTFSNGEYNIFLYKKPKIISQTELKAPDIDFGDCYKLVQAAYNISKNLIIAIADKKVKNNPTTNYLFFHPVSGIRLETKKLCQNERIKVNENILAMLDEKSENYELQKALTDQGINIFDLNDPYYKDTCYDFDNPKSRDMALSDRIKETYVNVTLCDDGCINTGIDLVNKVATCDCKFNEVTNNDLIHENQALEFLVGEFFDIINSSNILVFRCYKYFNK